MDTKSKKHLKSWRQALQALQQLKILIFAWFVDEYKIDMLHSHDPFVNSGREFDAGFLNKGRRGVGAVSDDFESRRS